MNKPQPVALTAALLAIIVALTAHIRSANPQEQTAGSEPAASFQFDTPAMSGEVRADGPYMGVTRLTDKRSGRQVIDERYSALNLFKLMSVNQVMDQPRKMPRDIALTDDGAVAITWPPSDGHSGTVVARYQVSGPDSIDLILTASVTAAYRDYELFLSNYFDKALQPHVLLKDRGDKPPGLVLPTYNEVFQNTVLVFARDHHASRRCTDGRWQRSENNEPHVQMTPVRHYAKCLAFVAAPEDSLGVLLTALPTDCYAISTRYFSEDPTRRNTSYSAFDFSLFGDDFSIGDSRTVRVRLSLTELDDEMSQAIDLYDRFITEDTTAKPPAFKLTAVNHE